GGRATHGHTFIVEPIDRNVAEDQVFEPACLIRFGHSPSIAAAAAEAAAAPPTGTPTSAEAASTTWPAGRPLGTLGRPAVLLHVLRRRLDDDAAIVALAFGVGRHKLVGGQRQVHDAPLAGNHRVELDRLAVAHRL